MNLKTLGFVPLALYLFTACGVHVGPQKVEKNDESYEYHFNENGCDTGEQKFDDKGDYCNALRNDSLNHYCAKSTRESSWKSHCQ